MSMVIGMIQCSSSVTTLGLFHQKVLSIFIVGSTWKIIEKMAEVKVWPLR